MHKRMRSFIGSNKPAIVQDLVRPVKSLVNLQNDLRSEERMHNADEQENSCDTSPSQTEVEMVFDADGTSTDPI